MPHHLRPLALLEAEQLSASAPRDHAALSASAGTGKTHVLTARVLRLLLAGVDPSSILCLTFTKAGAAEMADRIHRRLAYWVRLKDADLAAELKALGEDYRPEARAKARRLFARVLDASGGGLRIQTIHAFAQGLLAAFPAEAGLVPGFRPLEGREEQLLARQTLAEMLVRAEEQGDSRLIADLQAVSHRLGEGGAEAFVRRCARAPDAMTSLGPPELVEDRLRGAFGLPLGDIDEAIAGECCDEIFDVEALRRIGLLNSGWGTKNGLERASLCEQWASAGPSERAALLDKLHFVWAKADGEIRSFAKGQAPQDENYVELATAAFECCSRLLTMRKLASLVACLAAGLRAGQVYAEAWTAAKRAHAVLDFDDLIRLAERLLLAPGMGDWVRYKLDQANDHILVDEAQDTNEAQWNIVRALTLEYFAGEGASKRHRTLFTVGDYKQAIFGFQGTDPQSFEYARAWFARQAESVGRDFLDLSVDLSFRSSPPILAAVDRLIETLGFEALGLPRAPNPHESHHVGRPGSVTIWLPHSEDNAGGAGEDGGEEGWVSEAVRDYARRLAAQIAAWIRNPFLLGKGTKRRPVRPEDILVLVRRRGDLASLIVARLHAEGVPVAGVDRLALSAPLAVRDLLAAVRFAVQPLDDLNLGALLVSPLFGWTQDELFAASFRREGPLWLHIRGENLQFEANPRLVRHTLDGLHELLRMADYATPHAFLETILSGALRGRRKLLERLGNEARDPIEELLSSALDFESRSAPSLQRFLDWFARGEVEIVRDPSAPLDAVRVMTVHGSKGLQSPVVILADACADPDRKGGGFGGNFVTLPLAPDGPDVPIFRPRKDELAEPIASRLAQIDRREREEHWRLLYVASTRAEERLYVGGALGPADRRGPAAASWWSALDSALAGLGAEWEDDPHWGRSRRFGDPEAFTRAAPRSEAPQGLLPDWVLRPAPAEARPPRPLAPSALGEDDVADPPPSPAMRLAAQRGRLLHALFERLPDVPEAERAERAGRWLERSAGIEDAELRRGLVEDACRLIADPAHAELFGPGALAEAPIAAVVGGGVVVSGSVDRLLVAPDRILVADFKTGRRAPETLADIPVPHLRQMSAYVEALKVVFPGRPIAAKLLYTAAPVLFDLPADLLDRYRPVLEPTPAAS
ncbi:MAG TPA: double-strand break repair helicase AddA [Allosphingosinicella sp.]|jgi:ATP-dependent helicase/nuclease subunit A|nr:double-strand break repair helicase AddA [Allosphingosinicella sp.]